MIRVHHRRPVRAAELGFRVAHEFAEAVVDGDDAAIEADVRAWRFRVVEPELERPRPPGQGLPRGRFLRMLGRPRKRAFQLTGELGYLGLQLRHPRALSRECFCLEEAGPPRGRAART